MFGDPGACCRTPHAAEVCESLAVPHATRRVNHPHNSSNSFNELGSRTRLCLAVKACTASEIASASLQHDSQALQLPHDCCPHRLCGKLMGRELGHAGSCSALHSSVRRSLPTCVCKISERASTCPGLSSDSIAWISADSSATAVVYRLNRQARIVPVDRSGKAALGLAVATSPLLHGKAPTGNCRRLRVELGNFVCTGTCILCWHPKRQTSRVEQRSTVHCFMTKPQTLLSAAMGQYGSKG
jgi:hypothetical protein